jgi:AhpD family alkylhydroperoxidase
MICEVGSQAFRLKPLHKVQQVGVIDFLRRLDPGDLALVESAPLNVSPSSVNSNDRSKKLPVLDEAKAEKRRRQRELIAAYVSGLNACTYCRGTHLAVAAACGVAPEVSRRC